MAVRSDGHGWPERRTREAADEQRRPGRAEARKAGAYGASREMVARPDSTSRDEPPGRRPAMDGRKKLAEHGCGAPLRDSEAWSTTPPDATDG